MELVVSAALMSLLLGAGYLCLRSGLESRATVEARTEVFQTARIALARMTADLREACPLSDDSQFLGMHRLQGSSDADNLDFATHHYRPKQEHESDFCEISYFLRSQGTNHTFQLYRRRDATPDDQPLAGGTTELIADHIEGLRLEYYDGFEWFTEWGDPEGRQKGRTEDALHTNLTGLPEAVRITLWCQNTEPARPRSSANANLQSGASSDAANISNSESTAAPPLMFQTVVRLNLAGNRELKGWSKGNSSQKSGRTGGRS